MKFYLILVSSLLCGWSYSQSPSLGSKNMAVPAKKSDQDSTTTPMTRESSLVGTNISTPSNKVNSRKPNKKNTNPPSPMLMKKNND